jgi:hypothetical protein
MNNKIMVIIIGHRTIIEPMFIIAYHKTVHQIRLVIFDLGQIIYMSELLRSRDYFFSEQLITRLTSFFIWRFYYLYQSPDYTARKYLQFHFAIITGRYI